MAGRSLTGDVRFALPPATIKGMEPNPYEAPVAEPDGGRTQNEGLPYLRGCLSLVLLVPVLYFGCLAFVARIESYEELAFCYVIDALLGLSIGGIVVLSSPLLVRLPARRSWAVIAAITLAVFCSGSLISLHSYQVYVRSHAFNP